MKNLSPLLLVLLFLTFILAYLLFLPKEKNKTDIQEEEIKEAKVLNNTKKKIEKNNEILIYSNKIDPSLLNISLGEEIRIINKDSKEHIIIFSYPPLEKRILPDDIFIFSFSNSGTIEIIDKESGAKATIIVS